MRLLLLAMVSILAGGPALSRVAEAESSPACVVEVSLEPERAFVGQQILYRARVLMRDDVESIEWSRPLSFPRIRTEFLPGEPRGGRVERGGVAYRIHDELRALFAEAAGSRSLRAPDLRCRIGAAAVRAAVPAVELQVAEPPEVGRPEGFDGLIGPVIPHLTLTPREIRLGESVRVGLMLRGAGNLWVFDSPFPAELEGAELFLQRPELVLERGRSLFLRRHFVYDLVPRKVGTFRLPSPAIPYFDPERGAYAMARAEMPSVVVHPRAAPGAQPGVPGDRSAPLPRDRPMSQTAPSPPGFGAWPWAGLGAALAALALWGVWRRPGHPAAPAADPDAGSADAVALARALRTALAPHVSDASTVTPEALLARPGLTPGVEAAARGLAAVERARFDPNAPAPDRAEVERAIRAL